jgi:hypothetical protein
MTVLQPASWHDVLFMEDFLERASDAFDLIPIGVSVSAVDLVFRRWVGFAAEGSTDRRCCCLCSVGWRGRLAGSIPSVDPARVDAHA